MDYQRRIMHLKKTQSGISRDSFQLDARSPLALNATERTTMLEAIEFELYEASLVLILFSYLQAVITTNVSSYIHL